MDDISWCRENNVAYVPCVYRVSAGITLAATRIPGRCKTVGSIPRQGGRFYWQMLSTALNAGATIWHVAMFDEVNEATAIFKGSDNPPVSKVTSFITMDGKPSDHYLLPSYYWLTGQSADAAARNSADFQNTRKEIITA